MSVHFQSDRHDWETPQALFDELDQSFHFDLDVCATQDNAKCVAFFSPEDNGLTMDWGRHRCWMNPPYGRQIGKWIQKAYKASTRGATVVCLIPSRTDTRWWHEYVMRADSIWFIQGRLKFGNSENSAPFPSAIVIFNGHEGPEIASYRHARTD